MNFFLKQNSANSMESGRTSSASGCDVSGCEPQAARRPPPLASWATPCGDPVGGMSGIEPRSSPYWNGGESFVVRESGQVGQEILDAEGRVICWTTDPWLAQVIARLLERANRDGLLA